jgi:hypothetical protein
MQANESEGKSTGSSTTEYVEQRSRNQRAASEFRANKSEGKSTGKFDHGIR